MDSVVAAKEHKRQKSLIGSWPTKCINDGGCERGGGEKITIVFARYRRSIMAMITYLDNLYNVEYFMLRVGKNDHEFKKISGYFSIIYTNIITKLCR